MLAYVPGHKLDHSSWPMHPHQFGVADPEVSVFDTVLPPLEPHNARGAYASPVEEMDAVFTTNAPDYKSSNFPGMSAAAYDVIMKTSYPKRETFGASLVQPTYRMGNGQLFGISRGLYGPWIQPGISAAYQDNTPTDVQVYQSVGTSTPGACARKYPVM